MRTKLAVILNKLSSNNYLLAVYAVLLFLTGLLFTFLGGLNIKSCFNVIAYAISIIIIVERTPSQTQRLLRTSLLLLPVLIVEAPIHIVNFAATLISLPAFLAYFLGVALGWLTFMAGKTWRPFWYISILLAGFGLATTGNKIWLDKLNFGSFSYLVSEPLPEAVILKKETGQVFNFTEQPAQTLVLDFWTTSCAICFTKFPVLKAKQQHYASNKLIAFYTVNTPTVKDSIGQGNAVMQALPYHFQNLTIKDIPMAQSFGVTAYPVVLVVHKGRIIYRGDAEGLDACLAKL
ncbi:TlpA family protein disulfide reductase [Mucilaginibacter sp.]